MSVLRGGLFHRSRLFMPSTSQVGPEVVAKSHELLLKGGYIKASDSAGMYRMLPLADRILGKIEDLVDRHMQMGPVYAQKLRLPLLTSKDMWNRSGRWDAYGPEMMRLDDRRGRSFCLGPTHEEEITELVASLGVIPQKMLPLKLYQITTKFRDEMRPRFGLLRGREFLMKDLYSFHISPECARETYDHIFRAYCNILDELGLEYKPVLADSGQIGGDYTHEFQVLADIGEDDIVYCDQGTFAANIEVFPQGKVPHVCQDAKCSCQGKGQLLVRKGIEVGQTFFLGTKYSACFEAKGQKRDDPTNVENLFMGCYGIGISRLLAAIIEASAHEKTFAWPMAVAPFHVHIYSAGGKQEAVTKFEAAANELAGKLLQADPTFQVIIDDRWDHRLRNKKQDVELMGCPFVIFLGGQFVREGTMELTSPASPDTAQQFQDMNVLVDQITRLKQSA